MRTESAICKQFSAAFFIDNKPVPSVVQTKNVLLLEEKKNPISQQIAEK